jgi:hypothetical protein
LKDSFSCLSKEGRCRHYGCPPIWHLLHTYGFFLQVPETLYMKALPGHRDDLCSSGWARSAKEFTPQGNPSLLVAVQFSNFL